MAHTLTITDWAGTTTNLASDTSAAGYKLQQYFTVDPPPEVVYNTSIYVDGNRPVFARTGNIVESLVVDIYGSSRDDALNKLRYLKAAIWNARDTIVNPNLRRYTYLSYKPDSSTNTAYSIVLGGVVTEPQNILDTNFNDNKILGVIVTIEREPYWRGIAPIRSASVTDFAINVFATWVLTPDWGRQDVTGLIGAIPGLLHMRVESGVTALKWLVAGWSSELRAGTSYNTAGLFEAESMTPGSGFVVSSNASASGGNQLEGALTTSFALVGTGTKTLHGMYRVFARLYVTGGTTGTVYLTWSDINSAEVANTAVATTVSSHSMVDLGPISVPLNPSMLLRAESTSNVTIRVYAKRNSTAGSLGFDMLFFMPLEYYWSSLNSETYSGNFIVYDNTIPWSPWGGDAGSHASGFHLFAPSKTQGALYVPPGNGSLYLLGATNATFGNNASGNSKNINIYYVPRWAGARGNDV